jgi:predicted CXXCH cytochrome family protein
MHPGGASDFVRRLPSNAGTSAMTTPTARGTTNRLGSRSLLVLALVGGGALAVALGRGFLSRETPDAPTSNPRRLTEGKQLAAWWDVLPADVRSRSVPSGGRSNIAPADYAGPEACKGCHSRNYESWSGHPHRWMNAPAGATTVRGDFSGTALSYRGGKVVFSRTPDAFFMHLERGGQRRAYRITQTIGSRFFQYYVGRQTEGPEVKGHPFYEEDHVLPFGWWLAQEEWVPVIHIGPEVPDWQRPDPFDPPETGAYYAEYSRSCNYCHTTFALGDLFTRRPRQMGEHAPRPLHWALRPYLEETHPDVVPVLAGLDEWGSRQNPVLGWEASRHAVTFGVSCEACHLGSREHVESGGRTRPKFFPSSPHLLVETGGADLDFGRSHANVNWACGRCHTGGRPQFAAGMSTWNSVEYADAMRGSCYSRLRCIDCHEPHRPIGPRWSLTADQDDALCVRCHDKLGPAAARLRHTHHPAGSAGARCMNCHMPRINEGIEDVVRTHTIYSPTRADMLEANHPNACNLCHTDRPIDWTLRYLKEWYGAGCDERRVAAAYPDRAGPVGAGWLKSDNASVRLVAVEAMTRARDFRALPRLLDALDDPYLVNRQFAYKGLQEMLGVRLGGFGYRIHLTEEERRRPLADLRAKFAGGSRR